MSYDRRKFLKTSVVAGVLAPMSATFANIPRKGQADLDDLLNAANAPVLQLESLTSPVIIESIELLKSGTYYLVRSRPTFRAAIPGSPT
jgi:hypothetical protein